MCSRWLGDAEERTTMVDVTEYRIRCMSMSLKRVEINQLKHCLADSTYDSLSVYWSCIARLARRPRSSNDLTWWTPAHD